VSPQLAICAELVFINCIYWNFSKYEEKVTYPRKFSVFKVTQFACDTIFIISERSEAKCLSTLPEQLLSPPPGPSPTPPGFQDLPVPASPSLRSACMVSLSWLELCLVLCTFSPKLKITRRGINQCCALWTMLVR